MSRFQIIEYAIQSALQFGNDSGYNLADWLRDSWQVGLFMVAVLLGWRVHDDPEHLLIDQTTGPFYSEPRIDAEVEYFGHPWLPVYLVSTYPL